MKTAVYMLAIEVSPVVIEFDKNHLVGSVYASEKGQRHRVVK